MADLPVGTVAFLITDIESSTERWQVDDQEMSRALRVHDETLSSLVRRHDGVLFKHTGDGICAAFSAVRQAAATALDAQSALALAGQIVVSDALGGAAGRRPPACPHTS